MVTVQNSNHAGLKSINFFLDILNKVYYPFAILSFLVMSYTSYFAGVLSPLVFYSILLITGYMILYYYFSKHRLELKKLLRLFTLVFSFGILITCLFYIYYLDTYASPYESGGTDDARFEKQAYALIASDAKDYNEAKVIIAKEGTGTWHISENYVIVIASIHKFTEIIGLQSHTLNPRILNVFLLAITAIMVYILAKKCCKFKNTALFAAYYFGLFPSIVFCAAHIYRDILITFGIILTILSLISLFDLFANYASSKILNMVFTIFIGTASLIITVNLREGLTIIMFFLICFIFFLKLRSFQKKFLAFFFFLALFLFVVDTGLSDQHFFKIEYYLNWYTGYRSGLGGESGVGTGIFKLPALYSYPLRLFYLSLSPLPFPSHHITENFQKFGTIIWFYSLPYLLYALTMFYKTKQMHNSKVFLLLIVTFLLFYTTVAITTFQTRHFSMYAFSAAILIAFGLERSRFHISIPAFIMSFLGIIFSFVYLLMKTTII